MEKRSEMPNNYWAAKAQLQSLQKRLKKNPESMQLYEKSLSTDLEINYVKTLFFPVPTAGITLVPPTSLCE